MKTSKGEHKFVEKLWGVEIWYVNKEEYCGKLLHINKGWSCSWHRHTLKDETFVITKGLMQITSGYQPDRSDAVVSLLEPGDSFHVPVGLIHQMLAIEELEFYEFSTQHFDSDSERIEVGGYFGEDSYIC